MRLNTQHFRNNSCKQRMLFLSSPGPRQGGSSDVTLVVMPQTGWAKLAGVYNHQFLEGKQSIPPWAVCAPTEKASYVCSSGCTTNATSVVTFLEQVSVSFILFYFIFLLLGEGCSQFGAHKPASQVFIWWNTWHFIWQNLCNEVLISWHLSGMFMLVEWGHSLCWRFLWYFFLLQWKLYHHKKTNKPKTLKIPTLLCGSGVKGDDVFQVQVNHWLWLSLLSWLHPFACGQFLVGFGFFLWEQEFSSPFKRAGIPHWEPQLGWSRWKVVDWPHFLTSTPASMSLMEDIIFRHTKQHICNKSVWQETPHDLWREADQKSVRWSGFLCCHICPLM